jgi:hypothetical protein
MAKNKRVANLGQWATKKHTPESLMSEALKYNHRREYRLANCASYTKACRLGILDKVCAHMDRRGHTIESLTLEALKYNKRYEFVKANINAYNAAVKQGILDDICNHMDQRNRHTKESLTIEALKYNKRKDFEKANGGAYQSALILGIMDEICGHMPVIKRAHTIESLTDEALKYNTRSEFESANQGAYGSALDKGIMDEICGHMLEAIRGFVKSKPGILYYIRFDHDDECSLWKVGITNINADKRLKGISPFPGWKATILQQLTFINGTDCYEMERSLHTEFKQYKYNGPAILKNGNTELFTCNILNY